MRTITRSPAAAAGRSLPGLLKAILSLLVLAAAVVGLPLVLAWATPVIWSGTHDDLTHLLDRQDTGGAFLLLLVAVGWIGWAQFTVCAIRELIAQLRGRTWHAPRGLGASQRAAALLIGSILVLLPTSSALASDAQAAPLTAAALASGQAAQSSQSADHASPTSASTPVSRTYTVRETRPADSLWAIAERELGDGERWREIADLNEGQTMVDGTVFRANSFLQPGWQLRMPGPAAAAAGARPQLAAGTPAAAETGKHVVTVHSGDYLSKIAEKELGDGDAWPKLFQASQDAPQPDGLPKITNPNVIYAGQQVTVPEAQPAQQPQDDDQSEKSDSPSTTTPPAAAPSADSKQQTDESTGAEAPVPSQTTRPAAEPPAHSTPSDRPATEPESSRPSAPASPPADRGASTSPSAPASQPAGSAPYSPATAVPQTPAATPVNSSLLNLRIVLGAGALLAAAITSALALRRTLQRRRRQPGEKIAIAAETSMAEAQLAAAAEASGAVRLDVALRTLAHHVTQKKEDAVLPPLRAARIGARALEVLPEDLALDPVTPFTTGQGGWWSLPADALLLDEEAARDVPAPYPGLVTIGSTQAGDLLLLNLAGLPALLLDGNPVHITEVCTSLALELGMSPWAANVEIMTVGFGEDLPQLLPTTRIGHMRQAAHALRDLSERLLEAHQMPETQQQPYLLLCASSLDEDTAWQFADVIDRAGTVPVTLIAPAGTASVHFPEAEILNASLGDPQTLDYAGTDITVQRLEHAAYLQITTALKVSGQASHPAEGPWQDVPDELDSVPRPERASPQEYIVPTATAPSSHTAADDVRGEVFPALLDASTHPSGLRLLSPATTSADHAEERGPGTVTPPASVPAQADVDSPQAAAARANGTARTVKGPAAPGPGEREAHDLHAPEIRVLGPVEVTGVDSTGHGPRMAQLAALLYFRPGRSADVLCADMDPVKPWSTSTLNARMQGLRSSLGSDPSGNPYVPRRKAAEDPYRLAASVRCDWTRFLQLVERALPLGPSGLSDLEKALMLVRGKPFGGRPLPWAEPYQQEMTTRIIDVAHTVATYRMPPGPQHDLSAAHQAVSTGLEVDDTAELLYRDWMRLEAARGNRSGLHTAITRVQQVNRALDCSLEMETTQLINELLNGADTAVRKAR
ncbi:LysM peptidoglycan-binding domain-containing protein [Streptomyces sp. NPDC002159]